MVATSTPLPTLVAGSGPGLILDVIRIVLQTLFFGIYSVLVILSSRMLLKRGLKSCANRVMFVMTLLAYFLASGYWVFSFADALDRMTTFVHELQVPNPSSLTQNNNLNKWSPLFNAVLLINYIFSDVVVVWRAWVICWRNYRKYLCVTVIFLVLTALCVAGVIVFRVITQVVAPYGQLPQSLHYLVEGINILQISIMGFSLISNISATAVVGATAWRHRRSIRAAFADKKNTKANQILMLMVESGILYCISGLTVLISSLIRLPHEKNTLGDIYTPINVQIAGAYPSVVLLLVSTQRSLSETFLDTSEDSPPTQSGKMKSYGGSVMQFRNPEFSRIESILRSEEVPSLDTETV